MLALIPLLALPDLAAALHPGDQAGADQHGTGLNLNMVEGLAGWQTALVTLAAIGLVIF